MSQFALHPHSSVLLCCTTQTDFVLLILKCEMLFLPINILDLVVHGRPCVPCFFCILFLFQNELCMFLGHSCLFLPITGSIYYIGDTCNLLQAVVHPLLGLGIHSIFSKRIISIFWPSLFFIVNIDICSHVQMFSCKFIDYSCLVFCSFCVKQNL